MVRRFQAIPTRSAKDRAAKRAMRVGFATELSRKLIGTKSKHVVKRIAAAACDARFAADSLRRRELMTQGAAGHAKT